MNEPPFPQLRRVIDPTGSHIEPPLDQTGTWTDLDRLRWHAAVIRVDNEGAVICIDQYDDGRFGISTKHSGVGGFDFDSAWTYLNGIDHGLQMARTAR